MNKIRLLILTLLISISFGLWGQSALPAEANNFLSVTGSVGNGDQDPYMVVFLEVPDTVTGPIYFAVYDPGVDVLTSITPVDALKLNPVVDENEPPAKPVIVGVGSEASTQ